MKFIIALVPEEKQVNEALINLASQKLPHDQVHGYLLGKYSHPHLSLAHFWGFKRTYKRTQSHIHTTIHSHKPTITLRLHPKIFYKPSGYCELRPIRHNIDDPLQKLHETMINEIKPLGFWVTSQHGKQFTPHFTLGKLRRSICGNRLFYQSIQLPTCLQKEIPCVLAVGLSDSAGQFIRRL